MPERDPGLIDLSPAVMRDIAVVAKRTRDELVTQIGDHLGPGPDDDDAASLLGVAVAMILGDMIQRAGDPVAAASLINSVWRYCRWPIRLDLGSEQ